MSSSSKDWEDQYRQIMRDYHQDQALMMAASVKYQDYSSPSLRYKTANATTLTDGNASRPFPQHIPNGPPLQKTRKSLPSISFNHKARSAVHYATIEFMFKGTEYIAVHHEAHESLRIIEQASRYVVVEIPIGKGEWDWFVQTPSLLLAFV
jgi:hypothetical protein